MWVQQVEVCGDRVAVTVRSESGQNGGTTELVIIDWPSSRAKRVGNLQSFIVQSCTDLAHSLVAGQPDVTAIPQRFSCAGSSAI